MSRIEEEFKRRGEEMVREVIGVAIFAVVLIISFFTIITILVNWDYDAWEAKHKEESKQLLMQIESQRDSSHQ